MKHNYRICVIGFIIFSPLFLAYAQSGPSGGGGEIPTPLTSNQKVELADGENYYLVGTVVYLNDQPLFKVDLEVHSWLASEVRKNNPYYLLESWSLDWKRYENLRMRVLVRAHGNIIKVNDVYQYVISLFPMEAPVRD